MTARRAGTTLALLTGAALLVVACGGSAASTAPTQPPVTQAPPTQAAPSEAAPSEGLPSFALPSFHSDVELEKLIPNQLGGEGMATQSMSGATFLGTPNNEFAKVLTGLGKQASDLSVAFGFNMHISVIAFQIKGIPGSTVLDAFKNSSTAVGTLTDVSYGGKAVKKVTPPTDATQGTSYIYTSQDVVFVVSATQDTLTDALLNEAFSKLP